MPDGACKIIPVGDDVSSRPSSRSPRGASDQARHVKRALSWGAQSRRHMRDRTRRHLSTQHLLPFKARPSAASHLLPAQRSAGHHAPPGNAATPGSLGAALRPYGRRGPALPGRRFAGSPPRTRAGDANSPEADRGSFLCVRRPTQTITGMTIGREPGRRCCQTDVAATSASRPLLLRRGHSAMPLTL